MAKVTPFSGRFEGRFIDDEDFARTGRAWLEIDNSEGTLTVPVSDEFRDLARQVRDDVSRAARAATGDPRVITPEMDELLKSIRSNRARTVSIPATGRSIVQRDDNGRVTVAEPAYAAHATTKKYVDEKITAELTPGTTLTSQVNSYASGNKGTIVSRYDDGQIAVVAPTRTYHAANKAYVDAEIEKLRRALSGGGVASISPIRGVLLLVAGATCWLRLSFPAGEREERLAELSEFRLPEFLRPSWSAFGAVLHGGTVKVGGDGTIQVVGRDLQPTGGLYGQSMWVVEDKNAAKGWGPLPSAG